MKETQLKSVLGETVEAGALLEPVTLKAKGRLDQMWLVPGSQTHQSTPPTPTLYVCMCVCVSICLSSLALLSFFYCSHSFLAETGIGKGAPFKALSF